jgi:hypothetical protein
VVGWFVINTYLREPLNVARADYDARVSLDLPGSHDIRLKPEEDAMYEAISKGVKENCNALLMLPGMDSFYLWTEMEPPSYTATGWETLFDTEKQEKVVEQTSQIHGLCLLRNYGIQAEWGEGEGPLVGYLESPQFKRIGGGDGYELLRRDGAAPAGR